MKFKHLLGSSAGGTVRLGRSPYRELTNRSVQVEDAPQETTAHRL